MSMEKVSSTIHEYRICLPLSVEEYRLAHLYSVAEASKEETGAGEGVEIVLNEPFEGIIPGDKEQKVRKGQYTLKIIHLASKLPKPIRMLAPSGACEIMEKSWNAYPYCKTIYSNEYMKSNFNITIETRYEPGTGDIDNIHNLDAQQLAKRAVEKIDIVNDRCLPIDYKEEEDPSIFESQKTGRGPIIDSEWEQSQDPIMCCYKLYHIDFQWFGLQRTIERRIVESVRRLLYRYNRKLYCWIDKWYGMSIEDIRALEEKTKKDLDELRGSGEARGMYER